MHRVARVVGARAGHHGALRAQLVGDQADELGQLVVAQRRAFAGGARHDEPIGAVLQQVAAKCNCRLVIDLAVRAERRDHRGQQALVGAHEAHSRRVSLPVDRRS
jgi:hypothetical protein